MYLLRPAQEGIMPRKITNLTEYFWSKVCKTNTCWIWLGSRASEGYGRIKPRNSKTILVHRFSYELHKEKIPDGLTIDHLCRVRGCVNPEHLEAVTNRENIRRGISPAGIHSRKTHCPRGHSLSGYNLFIKKNTRQCRECTNMFKRIRYQKRRTKPADGAKVEGE